MQKKYYGYLDIAKGLGMLAVIWGHIDIQYVTSWFVYSFHMPLFFLLSGMLFNKDKYTGFLDFIKKRGKRLLIPYLIYSVVTWVIWVVYSYVTNENVDYFYPLLETLLARGSTYFLLHNPPLWFIPCLFAVEIMYYFLSKLRDVANILLCVLIVLVSILLEHFYGEDYLYLLPCNFDAAMMAIPFYTVGNLIVKHVSHDKIVNMALSHKMALVFSVLVLFVFQVATSFYYKPVSMGFSNYGNEAVFHLRAFTGSAMVILFSLWLDSIKVFEKVNKWLKYVGRKSMDFLCTHMPLKRFIIIIVAALLHKSSEGVVADMRLIVLLFVITVFLDWLIVKMIDKCRIKLKSNKLKK